jgi:hypothetical protein
MAGSPAFDRVCGELERATSLSSLEARGTVRIALRQAGFEAKRVEVGQMVDVIRRVLPRELGLRGIPDAAALCERLARGLADPAAGSDGDVPDDGLARLRR